MAAVEELDIPVGKHIIHTLDHTGDTRLIWDSENDAETAAARTMFDELKAKRFIGYKAEGKDGRKGEILQKFDPDAERIIMVPPQVGG